MIKIINFLTFISYLYINITNGYKSPITRSKYYIDVNNDKFKTATNRYSNDVKTPDYDSIKVTTNYDNNDSDSIEDEPMFSMSYDPLENPSQITLERDLEDVLMERALRFFDEKFVKNNEKCYLVGLEDKSLSYNKSSGSVFTMEESLTELSELAGAAGLSVVGSTYQRVQSPNIEYYIGLGKTKDIQK